MFMIKSLVNCTVSRYDQKKKTISLVQVQNFHVIDNTKYANRAMVSHAVINGS